MALLHIKSNNPNLSYVLAHNPQNPLICKTLKQGLLCGYYPNNDLQQYVLYFVDKISPEINEEKPYERKQIKNSFKQHVDAQFEYLNNNEFADARFIDYAFQSFLKTGIKGVEQDIECNNSITVFAVETNIRVIELFKKSYPDVQIEFELLYKNYFKITFTSVTKLQYLLKVLTVFSLFASLEGNSNYIYIQEDMPRKYLTYLKDTNASYFIRYVFKVNMLRSPKLFKELIPLLQENERDTCLEWTYGDTHLSRIHFIKDKLFVKYEDKNVYTNKNDLLDIGAGYDYRYIKEFAKEIELEGKYYHAIERDEDAYERINHYIQKNKFNFIKLYRSLEEFIETYEGQELNIICSEVLEHNHIDEAAELIKTIYDKLNYKICIFTVPNKNFNKLYFSDDKQLRHDDHKWEYTEEEFKKFFNSVIPFTNKTEYDYYHVGDICEVNGIICAPTQSIILKK